MKKDLKTLFEELVIEINQVFEFHKLSVGQGENFIKNKNFMYNISYGVDNLPLAITITSLNYEELLWIVLLDKENIRPRFNNIWLLDVDEFTSLLNQVREDFKQYINYDKLYPVDYSLFSNEDTISTELMLEDFYVLDKLPI